jgi:hypothetical protein
MSPSRENNEMRDRATRPDHPSCVTSLLLEKAPLLPLLSARFLFKRLSGRTMK